MFFNREERKKKREERAAEKARRRQSLENSYRYGGVPVKNPYHRKG